MAAQSYTYSLEFRNFLPPHITLWTWSEVKLAHLKLSVLNNPSFFVMSPFYLTLAGVSRCLANSHAANNASYPTLKAKKQKKSIVVFCRSAFTVLFFIKRSVVFTHEDVSWWRSSHTASTTYTPVKVVHLKLMLPVFLHYEMYLLDSVC